jgi:hypothetical protein
MAAVVLSDHELHVDIPSCRLCRRLLKAGFAVYTRLEAKATFGIDPREARSGPSGPVLIVSIHGDDAQARKFARGDAGAPVFDGC